VKILTLLITGFGNAESGGDGGAGVSGVEDIVRTFLAPTKAAQTLVLTNRVELVMAAREQFVGIGLVPDIPDNLIARRVEQVMQGNGQFGRA
jgi:hypothetical protein